MAAAQKDTIYLDVDDEITSVIDKVQSSKHKIIALVLPKRATVLQSIVNMKLLKKASDDSKKKIVLITSEATVLPLAGAVGFYVARTLQSKPAIPAAPALADANIIDAQDQDATENLDPTAPVGELAGLSAAADDEETIEVGDDPAETATMDEETKVAKPNKKLKVPNFNKFRTWLILGGVLLVLLIAGGIFATTVLPKARIVIKTDTSSYTTDISATAGTKITEFSKENRRLPATQKELKKTDTEKISATGSKDMGEKASGTVSLKNCTKSDEDIVVPAGTGVSTNNLTYITKQDVTLPASSFSGSGTCTTGAEEVGVTAQSAGDKYNLSSGRTFSVAGFSSVTGTNTDSFSGGTTRIVKVVSQSDIDTARQRITDRANTNAVSDLKKQLANEDLIGLEETLNAGNPVITSSPQVDQEATEVTVTSVITYTLLGVKEGDVKQLVEEDAKKNIDTGKQEIRDIGLDKAVYRVREKKPNGEITLGIESIVVAGPDLNADNIKKEIAGKKRGETQSIIQSRPGIREVDVNYSPFWVYSTPKNVNKITVEFQDSNADNR